MLKNLNDQEIVERYSFKRAIWQSITLLHDVNQSSFDNIPANLKQSIHDEMWNNLAAEYDAIHLSKRLRAQKQIFTEDFLAFEHIWLLDEMNHYLGLRKIYSMMFGFDEAEIHSKITARIPNFTEIEDFLNDEFTLCVCFSYDELASTKGYAEAFPLYDSFGVPSVSKWIRLAARDELYHSLNAQSLIKSIHHKKFLEVPKILRKIVLRDSSRHDGYKATFLFDHDFDPENNPFSANFLKNCANDVCKYLSIPLAFEEQIEHEISA